VTADGTSKVLVNKAQQTRQKAAAKKSVQKNAAYQAKTKAEYDKDQPHQTPSSSSSRRSDSVDGHDHADQDDEWSPAETPKKKKSRKY
jgi:hypothetical protein